jgi:superfamily II DNA/RNA helicase
MSTPQRRNPASNNPRRAAGSNQPGRRPNRRSNNNQARPAKPPVVSELDLMLDEALARPEPEIASFAELGVPEPIIKALVRRGVTAPFAIQTRALADGIAGRDVLGRAQTGSGKTLAFGIPMVARLAGRRSNRIQPRGLVLVPTRELAMQVADALRPLADAVNLKMTAVFGGAPYGGQINALVRGVDIIVATPGRLIDLIDRGSCDLSQVEIAVLDEADHMADLGFMPAVVRLLDDVPAKGQRLLFSATLDRGVDKLVRGYLKDPAVHAVAPAASPVESMDHQVFLLEHADKVAIAAEIASRPGRSLVFVRTKHGADRLAKQLTKMGADASAIHGNLSQNQRQRALAGFTAGHPRVLVATDVAARGIHVDDVDLVVHFDPPHDHKDYLHRSGRTARAGASGTVVSFVIPAERRAVERLHQDAKVEPTAVKVRPGHEAVRAIAESGTPVPPAPPAAPFREQRSERPRRSGPPRHGRGRPQSGENRSGGYQGGNRQGGGGQSGNRHSGSGQSSGSSSSGGYRRRDGAAASSGGRPQQRRGSAA